MDLKDVGVEGVRSFFYFYRGSGDKVSHLSETVDEDKDITVRYSHKVARWKRTYVVHRNITPSALRDG